MPVSIIEISAESVFFDSLDNSQFEGCTDLEFISLEGLSVDSPIPTVWKELGVEFIYVYDSGLTGSLDNLADANYDPIEIWIDKNGSMTGTIPKEFFDNNNVESYSFTENNLSGTIPTEFGSMNELTYLWLYGNNLIGAIPTEIASFPRLALFRVENNNLSGTMPIEICNAQQLNLNKFRLVGADPSLCSGSCCQCTNIVDCDAIQAAGFR